MQPSIGFGASISYAFFERHPDPALVLNATGQVLHANPARDRERALDSGFDSFLAKPLRPATDYVGPSPMNRGGAIG